MAGPAFRGPSPPATRPSDPVGQVRAGKAVAVLGAGREGAALARYLLAHGVRPTVCDWADRRALGKVHDELSQQGVQWRLGKNYLSKLSDFELVYRSPGIPWLSPEIQAAARAGVAVTSATKFFFERCPATIIGVSGTKGKGTTSKLLESMLRRANKSVYLGGNIGLPPVEFLDKLRKTDLVILELSSLQLQDLEQSPHLAILTNLTVDHLDHHRNVAEYHQAKSSLVRFQGSDDLAILNADDPGSQELAAVAGGQLRWFSHRREVSPGAYVDGGEVVMATGKAHQTVCQTTDIPVPGPHNQDNVLAALLAADELGVSPAAMAAAIKAFRGLEHHLELVGRSAGVTYINDSYATNPTATIPAIESFRQPLVLIAGGSDKGLDYGELAKVLVQRQVRGLVLIEPVGRTINEAITAAARQAGQPPPPSVVVKRKSDIVKKAAALAKKGDVVLLSPATASFGMFANYRERGTFFKEQVSCL